jgi:LacI family transcriptional regulator
MRVGDDIAVACLDDPPIASLHNPAITALSRDIQEMADTAASMLVATLSGEMRQPRTVVLPMRLMRRGSTAVPVPSAPGVASR